MASFPEFVRFCAARTGCDKGGLYAIQPRGLRGSPIKIGYSFNLLRRLAAWEYSYPAGIDVLAVARMNRPNDTLPQAPRAPARGGPAEARGPGACRGEG